MAKYSLGTATTKIKPTVNKGELYLDPDNATRYEQDMAKQFTAIKTSLTNINTLMTKAVQQKIVKGSYADAFKGWAKKSKSQATAAGNRLNTLTSKFEADTKDYTIKLLDQRITQLENLVNSMTNE